MREEADKALDNIAIASKWDILDFKEYFLKEHKYAKKSLPKLVNNEYQNKVKMVITLYTSTAIILFSLFIILSVELSNPYIAIDLIIPTAIIFILKKKVKAESTIDLSRVFNEGENTSLTRLLFLYNFIKNHNQAYSKDFYKIKSDLIEPLRQLEDLIYDESVEISCKKLALSTLDKYSDTFELISEYILTLNVFNISDNDVKEILELSKAIPEVLKSDIASIKLLNTSSEEMYKKELKTMLKTDLVIKKESSLVEQLPHELKAVEKLISK